MSSCSNTDFLKSSAGTKRHLRKDTNAIKHKWGGFWQGSTCSAQWKDGWTYVLLTAVAAGSKTAIHLDQQTAKTVEDLRSRKQWGHLLIYKLQNLRPLSEPIAALQPAGRQSWRVTRPISCGRQIELSHETIRDPALTSLLSLLGPSTKNLLHTEAHECAVQSSPMLESY